MDAKPEPAEVEDIRLCIFCDQPGVSEEHVIPKMASREILKLSPLTAAHGKPPSLMTAGRRVKTRRLIELVVQAPCTSCNNVWFNALQKPVEPFLRASIHDKPFRIPDLLTTVEIATWAYKTALLIPLFGVDRDDWPAFIPVRARELRKKGRPPVGVRVWAGRFDFRNTWPDLASRSEVSELVFRTGGQDYNGYQVVFTLGFLLFMVVHWSVAPPKVFEVDPRRLPPEALVQLWPAHVGAKSWPPEDSVTYEQLGSLANFTDGEPPPGPWAQPRVQS